MGYFKDMLSFGNFLRKMLSTILWKISYNGRVIYKLRFCEESFIMGVFLKSQILILDVDKHCTNIILKIHFGSRTRSRPQNYQSRFSCSCFRGCWTSVRKGSILLMLLDITSSYKRIHYIWWENKMIFFSKVAQPVKYLLFFKEQCVRILYLNAF